MAENFNLIFGSQAPTTASWSDADYQTGWNVVGSTPPTAEQFDALQNRSDKKAQELNNRLSPLEQKAQEQGRQAGTAYTVGAAVTVDGLPADWLLVCTTAGTSGTAAITLPNPLIDGATITDGTITWKLRKVATNGGLGYRQPSTAYAVGSIAYHASLPTGWYLKCTTKGTTSSGELTISSPSIGGTVSDGTVKWQVRKGVTLPYELPSYMETLLDDGDAATARATLGAPSTTGANASGSWNINAATATKLATARTIALSGDATGSATFDGSGNATIATTLAREVGLTNLIPDNAGAHNAIYRGKALGAAVTAAQWAAIKAGTFRDLFIGDYWTINNVNWHIAAFDYWLHCGDTECTTHHVVIVPDTNLTSCKMNSTSTTAGGYVGSDFYTGANGNTAKATAVTVINSAFGSEERRVGKECRSRWSPYH